MKFAKYFLAFFCAASCFAQAQTPADFVDTWIGSRGGGSIFIGPYMPFGMIKPSPDTGDNGRNGGWGDNGNINGFSQTHVSGTGGGAKYGNILIMPANGELNISDISSARANEVSRLGYYGVDLTRYAIRAEIAASEKAAIYKFSFPAKEGAKIIFDAGHLLFNDIAGEGQHLCGSSAEVLSKCEVAGHTSVRGGWNLQKEPYTVYFYAVADAPAAKFGVFKGGEVLKNQRKVSAQGAEKSGAWLEFGGSGERVVHLKIGISFVSVEKAKANVKQIKNFDFDAACSRAVAAWNRALGAVEAKSDSDDKKKIFYTGLYHAMLMPSDRTGENPLWKSSEPYYDDFYAIWDTFRTSGPLLTLIAPRRQADIIRALVDIQKREGFLPDGRSGNCNGRTQGGSNADVYIADAFAKGLKGVNWLDAYAAVKADAENEPADGYKEGRGGLKDWHSLGYLSVEGFKMSGCKNVEYAYNNFCLMQMARALGKNDDAKKYAARAGQWQNVWDENLEHSGFKGFIRPKHRDGRWLEPFTPMDGCSWGGDTFYEGNSWTYSFYVLQDMKSLIEKCGGAEAFTKRLDEFFNGKCDISNEPFFLTPYLYIFANRHDKTAERVCKVKSCFGAHSAGIPGNDDSGALGAWFSWSAMGLFPAAGQDYYFIGSPSFDEVKFNLKGGKSFVVKAENLSDKNFYVAGATLNGKPLKQAWIRHSQILAGGELILKMSASPDNSWLETPPPSPLSDLKN
ncbi:MAG: GH92 family glycosyl hydrolase [Opitutales bacterium]|nr:GH92 family glycosyl hydrolase [Opitutales bacterium]